MTTPEPARTASVVFGHHRPLDGLRGVAVVAVVLYHFAPGLVPGGFLGVDVFFVLSGFLITSLILAEFRADGAVSAGAFWTRRIRRLLPAALAVIGICVTLAWFLEPASSRAALRTQSLASLFYVNNWSAIATGGTYESRFGHDLPLSHFWSLAVEEQFYILFPILIIGIILLLRRPLTRGELRETHHDPRRLTTHLLGISVAATLASIGLMMVLHGADTEPSRVYFGSDTRVHALLIGVATACLNALRPVHDTNVDHRSRIRSFAGLSALILMITAFVLAEFRQNWLYEGGLAAVAVLTAMIIWWVVRSPGHPLDRVLAHRVLVQLGLVSYGIYLWHWPARAFITTERTGLDGVALFTARMLATAIATTLSLLLLERPFRHRDIPSDRRLRRSMTTPQLLAVGGSILAVTLLCVVLTNTTPRAGSSSVAAPPPPLPTSAPTGPVRVLLVGDSVAWSIGGGDLAFPQPTTYVSPFDPNRTVLWNRSHFGLSLLRWPKRHDGIVSEDCPTCDPVIDWRSDIERFRPDLVVFSTTLWDTYDTRVEGRWLTFGSDEFDRAYLSALGELRDTVEAAGARLAIMVQPIPTQHPQSWSDQFDHDSSTFPEINRLLRTFVDAHPDVGLIDLDGHLCPAGSCTMTDAEGRDLRTDGLHFSPEGAAQVAPFLSDRFEQLRAAPIHREATAQSE